MFLFDMKKKSVSACILFAASSLWGTSAFQLPFRLELNSEVVALQFDITTEAPGIELSASEVSESAAEHSVSSAEISATTTRFIIHDPDNAALSDGAFLEMTIGISAPSELKDLSLSLSNLVFANSAGTQSLADIKNPPVVELRNPSNARSYPVERSVILKVDAADADGRLETVEFLINDSPLSEDNFYPHEALWDPATGNYMVKVVVTDNDGLSSETGEIPVRIFSLSELETYDAFKSIYFSENSNVPEIADPGSDPDGDAMSNLLEYFLSLDPVEADAQFAPFFYLTEEEGNQFMVIQFTKLTAPQDLSFLVQSSGDMAAWVEQLDLTTETTDHGDGTATVEIKVPVQEGSNLSNFLRLQITNE